MKAFAQLFTAIDQTTKINRKIEALVQYLSIAPPEDAVWAVALLSGRKPKRTVRSGEMAIWCSEIAKVPLWLYEECYTVVGDLAETIALMLPETDRGREMPLHEMMKLLASLGNAPEEERRDAVVSLWMELPPEQRFLFNKLITGNFRVGVSQSIVVKALARHFSLEENVVAHRISGSWDPASTTLNNLLLDGNAGDDISRPYPFYLAYQLEGPPEELGNTSEWLIERKYDGIRGQVIVRGGKLFVWSRGEELMTAKFPEFSALVNVLPDGTVLDGEILPVRDGLPLPFHVMQTRIGRKEVSKKQLAAAPIHLMCYDVLEFQGSDLRDKPLSERRRILEELLQRHNGPSPLLLSPAIRCSSWEEVRQERLKARDVMCEGLMLKSLDSVYETGRRKGKWWKWKVDPLSADGVLIYAQRGHGRRANLYTDYTFAVWDGEILVPFTKAYSGLTDKEILQVDGWIRKNTIEKFGPVRSVRPELVFEIAFEGIQPSPRHKSGIALRFPRISRWRQDKQAGEANTKEDLLQLIKVIHGEEKNR